MFQPFKPASQVADEAYFDRSFAAGCVFDVSPKIDGIRALTLPEGVHSYRMKPIPNDHIQAYLMCRCPVGVDGELVVPGLFNDVQSAIMSRSGEPDFTYYVFDTWKYPAMSYEHRAAFVYNTISQLDDERIRIVPVVRCFSTAEVLDAENKWVDEGYEGLIARVPWGLYKYGRSTLTEGIGVKMKRFHDDEAVIIGYKPLLVNHNAPKINAHGLQERGHGLGEMHPADKLGALHVYHPVYGQFWIGSGFTDLQRCKLWEIRETLPSLTCTFKFQPHGVKDAPRAPIFKCIRHPHS